MKQCYNFASAIKHNLENSRKEKYIAFTIFLFIMFFLSPWCSEDSFIISFLFIEIPLDILLGEFAIGKLS